MTGASLNPKAKVTLKIKAVTLRKSFKSRYFCPRFFSIKFLILLTIPPINLLHHSKLNSMLLFSRYNC